MKKIFILCALLITMFTSVCGAEPVSSYCKLDQSVAQFHGFSGNLF